MIGAITTYGARHQYYRMLRSGGISPKMPKNPVQLICNEANSTTVPLLSLLLQSVKVL